MAQAAVVQRSGGEGAPRISVLVATYERPELLASCLEGFCDQTLPASEFEVVVVDDGSSGPETQRVLTDFSDRLPLTWTRIDHSGRSAAKNLALLLARATSSCSSTTTTGPRRTSSADTSRLTSGIQTRRRPSSDTPTGHPRWSCSPLMHYLTDVDRLLFAYPKLRAGRA